VQAKKTGYNRAKRAQSGTDTMPQRATSTSFKPGHAPTLGGGRPKLDPLQKQIIKDIKAAAREHAALAIATLVRNCNAESEAVQVTASNSLLDRGFGKPKETLEKTNNFKITRTNRLEISHLSEEELDALENALRKTNMLMIEGKKEEDD
jgi:hypothetical protein